MKLQNFTVSALTGSSAVRLGIVSEYSFAVSIGQPDRPSGALRSGG